MAVNIMPYLTPYPTGQAAALAGEGISAIGQGFRDQEAKSVHREREALARRQQDERERAAGVSEEFRGRAADMADNEFAGATHMIVSKLIKEGRSDEAAAFAESRGSDEYSRGLTPERQTELDRLAGVQFTARQAQMAREESEAATKAADEELIAKIVSEGTEESETPKEQWDAEASAAALPGILDKLTSTRLGKGTQLSEADKANDALDADLKKFITSMGSDEQAVMGAPPQQQPQVPLQGMGMQPPVQQPPQVQQQQQGTATMASAPGMAGPGMQSQMMAPPAAGGFPGQSPVYDSFTPREKALTQGGTGIMGPGGIFMDPYAVAKQREQDKIQGNVEAVRAVSKSMIEAFPEGDERTLYTATGQAVEALVANGMSIDDAWSKIVDESSTQRHTLERLNKLKIQEGKIRAARAVAGRKDASTENRNYDRGEKMVQTQLKAQNFDEMSGVMKTLHDAKAKLLSKNPSDHMGAVYDIANSRDPGAKMSDKDIIFVPGVQGPMQQLDKLVQWMKGKPGRLNTKVLIESVDNMMGLTRDSMKGTHRAAVRAAEKAERRGEMFGEGAYEFLDTTFGDPRFDFLYEDETPQERRKRQRSKRTGRAPREGRRGRSSSRSSSSSSSQETQELHPDGFNALTPEEREELGY